MAQVKVKMSKQTDQAADVFLFPQGIAGFPDARHFAFIYEGRGNMVCMQSTDMPEAAFILTPWDEARLGEAPALSQEQRSCLGLTSEAEVIWMVVLNPFADAQWVTANLKAPVVLSEFSRKGFQLIRPEAQYDLRYHWIPQPKRA